MIDPAFHLNKLDPGSDTELFNKQKNHFASILERVLQTSEEKRLTRKHADDPRKVWHLHQAYSTSFATSSSICTGLGQELAKLKIVDFDTPTKGLDTFDSYLTQFNKISPVNSKMPDNLAVMYLKAATCGNSDLLSAWTQRKCMKEQLMPGGPTPSYDEYYRYLFQYAKKLKVAVEINTPAHKVNSSETDYLTPNSPSDPYFNHATDLSTYMVNQDMLAGGVPKMMASKQLEVRDPVTNKLVSYITYAAKMATIDYSRCDSLVPIEEPVVDLHYKVNLLHSYEIEYRANLLKRDRVVGGKHLVLVDGGANGAIVGLDMKILFFNSDGRQVSIGIAGDHQLTGNRLCC